MRPLPPHSDSRRGFTLVELIVATTLLTIVMTAVYTAFSGSIRAWRVGEASLANFQEARTALSLLTRELQCVIPGSEPFFAGSKNELTFYVLSPPMNVEEGEGPRVMRVEYRLRDDPDGPGKILLRQEALVEEALPVAEEGKDPDTKMVKVGREHTFELAREVQRLEIEYVWVRQPERQGSGFSQEAEPAERIVVEENEEGWGLPKGLKVRLTLADANSEEGETVFATTVAFHGPTTDVEARRLGSKLGAPLFQ